MVASVASAAAQAAPEAAPDGALDSVAAFLSAPTPRVSLFTEPFDASASHSLRERVQLVAESCRPWGEFADRGAFNAVSGGEMKRRVAHNVETFLYNYVVVGFGALCVGALVHPLRAAMLALWMVAAMLVYIVFPEDYAVTESFAFTKALKHVLMTLMAVLVLTVGGVLKLLLLVLCIALPLVLVHAVFREHDAQLVSSNGTVLC